MHRNTKYNRNNTPTNQLRLEMPKDMSWYEKNSLKKPIIEPNQPRLFRAIKNPNGWWVYSNDSIYAEIGSLLKHKKIKSSQIRLDAQNIDLYRGNKDFELVSERFISNKLIQGSKPTEIQHNLDFLGLDWVDSDGKVVFLEHVK